MGSINSGVSFYPSGYDLNTSGSSMLYVADEVRDPFTGNIVSSGNIIVGVNVNTSYTSINSMQQILGLNPQGAYPTVGSRFLALEAMSGTSGFVHITGDTMVGNLIMSGSSLIQVGNLVSPNGFNWSGAGNISLLNSGSVYGSGASLQLVSAGSTVLDFTNNLNIRSIPNGPSIVVSFASGSTNLYQNLLPNISGNITIGSATMPFNTVYANSISGSNLFANLFSGSNIYITSLSTMLGNVIENSSNNTASNISHAEGFETTATGSFSHAEGFTTTASNTSSHAEGAGTVASGQPSHAEGDNSVASGAGSHAEGGDTLAAGEWSHAEGLSTIASGTSSHAEGNGTIAIGEYGHTEGNSTTASGKSSHAEGDGSFAIGITSHAEGDTTTAGGNNSHAQGLASTASGNTSFAAGTNAFALHDYSMVFSDFNGATSTNTNQFTMSFVNGINLASGTSIFAGISGVNTIGTTITPFSGVMANAFFPSVKTISSNYIATGLDSIIIVSNTSSVGIGVPSFQSGKQFVVIASGVASSNNVTISGIAGTTINGSASIVINSASAGGGANLYSDGKNYWSTTSLI